MIDNSLLAFAAILSPILVATIAHLIAKIPRYGDKLAKALCVLTSYFTLVLILALIHVVVNNGSVLGSTLAIPLPIGTVSMSLYVDYLALIPALLSSLFTALALTYNVYYLSPYNRAYKVGWEFNRSYSFILLFNGAMLGALFSSSLLSLIIFLELISVCSYVLISFWNEDQFCLWAAIKCFIMTHVGSLALLMATVIIYFTAGTLEISELGRIIPLGDPVISVIFPLLLIAALPKAVQFPFHTWLPDATVAPTSAMILFLASDLTGIYLLVRFFLHVFYPSMVYMPIVPFSVFFGNLNIWSFTISLVGAVTLIIGALNGLVENDFKRIVAYGSISGLGCIMMAAGLGTPLCTVSSLFLMISHALGFGLLFLCAGAVIYATGKHDINELGGLYRHMPITAICCLIGVLNLSTTPLLSEFASKYLLLHATINVGATFFTIIAFLGCVFNAAIAMRLLHSVFLQKAAKSALHFPIKDPPVSMLAPMVLASVALVIFGVAPMIPLGSLVTPAVKQIGFPVDMVAQLGLIETPLGFWNPTAVAISMLALSAVFICMTFYSRKIAAVYRESVSEETFKPFLCGEDSNLLDGPHGYHFYHTLTNVLKVDSACHSSNIDRAYNVLSTKFFNSCTKLLRFDIHQRYFAAVLSFIVGAIIIVLIAILAG